jgi:hypothetical protein
MAPAGLFPAALLLLVALAPALKFAAAQSSTCAVSPAGDVPA